MLIVVVVSGVGGFQCKTGHRMALVCAEVTIRRPSLQTRRLGPWRGKCSAETVLHKTEGGARSTAHLQDE